MEGGRPCRQIDGVVAGMGCLEAVGGTGNGSRMGGVRPEEDWTGGGAGFGAGLGRRTRKNQKIEGMGMIRPMRPTHLVSSRAAHLGPPITGPDADCPLDHNHRTPSVLA